MTQLNEIEKEMLDAVLGNTDEFTRGFRACMETALAGLRSKGITVTGAFIDSVLGAYPTFGPALDYEEIAMAGAFMWNGALELWPQMENCEAPGDTAQTSWVYSITKHAALCERRWLSFQQEFPDCFDGVWSYEVCEVFGLNIAQRMLTTKAGVSDKEASAILDDIMQSHVDNAKKGVESRNGK